MERDPKLILIVDDSPDIQDMYARYLTGEGFEVALAANGQEGFEKAIELQPDLIVMDLWLPLLSGSEATQRLKKNEKTRHIPVVLLTGHSTEGMKAVIDEGCEGFLIKPSAPENMLKEIVRVLRRGPNWRPKDRHVAALWIK